MKKIILIFLIAYTFSCSSISEKEKRINSVEKIASNAYNVQMSGDVETFKSLLSEDFTFILNGEFDISQNMIGMNI